MKKTIITNNTRIEHHHHHHQQQQIQQTFAASEQSVNNIINNRKLPINVSQSPNRSVLNGSGARQPINPNSVHQHNDLDENVISIQLNKTNAKLPNKSASASTTSTSSSSSSNISTPTNQHIKPEPTNTNTNSSSSSKVDVVSNPDNHKFIQLRPTQPAVNPSRRVTTGSHNLNTNSAFYASDSGYAESSRKSNKSSYYSDISITVYDNIVGSNSAQTNGGSTSVNNIINNINNKSNGNLNAHNGSDVVVVSVTQQPSSNYHPQIQPMHMSHFNSQFVPSQILPIQYAHGKSMSVNDFTGSILAADRVHFYNKQQQQAAAAMAAAESSKQTSSSNIHDSLYSSVAKRENKDARQQARSSSTINANDLYLYSQQQSRIPIVTGYVESEHIPSRSSLMRNHHQQQLNEEESASKHKKRSSSEAVHNDLTYERVVGFDNTIVMRNQLLNDDHNAANEVNYNSLSNEKQKASTNRNSYNKQQQQQQILIVEDTIEITKNQRINTTKSTSNTITSEMDANMPKANSQSKAGLSSEQLPTGPVLDKTIIDNLTASPSNKYLRKQMNKPSANNNNSNNINTGINEINKLLNNKDIGQNRSDELSYLKSRDLVRVEVNADDSNAKSNINSSYEIPISINLNNNNNNELGSSSSSNYKKPISIQNQFSQMQTVSNTSIKEYDLKPSIRQRYPMSETAVAQISAPESAQEKPTPPPPITSIDIEIFNTSSKESDESASSLSKQQAKVVVMPRANRRKHKPYQISCDGNVASVQSKALPICVTEVSQDLVYEIEQKQLKSKVSLSLPVKSTESVKMDEGSTLSLEFAEANTKAQGNNLERKLEEPALRYSNLSIKFIDDSTISAPLSPEVAQSAKKTENKEDRVGEVEEKQQRVEIPIEKAQTPESEPIDSVSSAPISTEATVGTTQKTKKRRHHRHTITNSFRRSFTTDNISDNVAQVASEKTSNSIIGLMDNVNVNVQVTTSSSSSSKSKKEHRRDRRLRHTIPIATTTTSLVESNKDGDVEGLGKSDAVSNELIYNNKQQIVVEKAPSIDIYRMESITTTSSSDEEERRKPIKPKQSSFKRRESYKKLSEHLAKNTSSSQSELKPSEKVCIPIKHVVEPKIVSLPIERVDKEMANAEAKVEAESLVVDKRVEMVTSDLDETHEIRRKVIEWEKENVKKLESKSRDSGEMSDFKSELHEEDPEEEEDDAFKSGCDYSMVESYDEESLEKNKKSETEACLTLSDMEPSGASKTLKLVEDSLPKMVDFDETLNTSINNQTFASINDSTLTAGLESSINNDDATTVTGLPPRSALNRSRSKYSGAKSDTEGEPNRFSLCSNTSDLVVRSLRKKHDSTDTLDSASSYEIRFERPKDAEAIRLHKQALKEKIEQKNNQWNISASSDQAKVEKLELKQRELERSEISTVSEPDKTRVDKADKTTIEKQIIDSVVAEVTQELAPETSVMSEEENKLFVMIDDVVSIIANSSNNHSNMSSPIAIEDQPMTKSDDMSESKSLEINSSKCESNSEEYSSSEVSPRFKNESESVDNEQIVLLEQIAQIETTPAVTSESAQIDELKPTAGVETALDKSEESGLLNVVADEQADKPSILINPTVSAVASIFDDGYGSTVSIKNATNESYSSIDDNTSELSVLSNFSGTHDSGPSKKGTKKPKAKSDKLLAAEILTASLEQENESQTESSKANSENEAEPFKEDSLTKIVNDIISLNKLEAQEIAKPTLKSIDEKAEVVEEATAEPVVQVGLSEASVEKLEPAETEKSEKLEAEVVNEPSTARLTESVDDVQLKQEIEQQMPIDTVTIIRPDENGSQKLVELIAADAELEIAQAETVLVERNENVEPIAEVKEESTKVELEVRTQEAISVSEAVESIKEENIEINTADAKVDSTSIDIVSENVIVKEEPIEIVDAVTIEQQVLETVKEELVIETEEGMYFLTAFPFVFFLGILGLMLLL
jgi:hypothetical protein